MEVSPEELHWKFARVALLLGVVLWGVETGFVPNPVGEEFVFVMYFIIAASITSMMVLRMYSVAGRWPLMEALPKVLTGVALLLLVALGVVDLALPNTVDEVLVWGIIINVVFLMAIGLVLWTYSRYGESEAE